MKNITLLLFLLLPFSAFCQWQATMTTTMFGGRQVYTVYSDLTQYRYEYNNGEMEGAVIINPESNASSVLFIDNKQVHHTQTDGKVIRKNDPVQHYYSLVRERQVVHQGIEVIEGYNCYKETIYDNNDAMFSRWFSEELNFPLKMVHLWNDNALMELSNIQPWDVDPDKFIVPDDYIEVDEIQRPIEK